MVRAAKKRRAATPGGERIIPLEGHDAKAGNISVFDAVRAFGVMAGPSALFDLFLVGSVIAAIRAPVARRLRPLVALGTALAVAYPAVIRPWMMRWGATDEERHKPLPGDELVPDPLTTSTRAITVNAPVEVVWPWLMQMGTGRAGWYSYAWLENLLPRCARGAEITNAERIIPEFQNLKVGDSIPAHLQATYFPVKVKIAPTHIRVEG
jgi:hypothetical protein